MFLFSIHPNSADVGNHALYAKGFAVKMTDTINRLADLCLSNLNSPVIWKCGIRKADNFAFAEFAVLDVDDDTGMNLDQAMEAFRGFVHIIGTTKSHQKDKGGKVCDRYRVFIALEERVSDPIIYQSTNAALARKYSGDLQATAGHMAFMPLKKIVGYSEVGKRLPLERIVVRKPQRKFVSSTTYGENRIVPRYIQDLLTYGASPGERNLACFKIASGLRGSGFFEDEVVQLILSSSVPIDQSERVQREIRSAVRSAFRRAK